jgi:hypothetical protein
VLRIDDGEQAEGSFDDANWLVGEAELRDARGGGAFHATQRISLRTMELAAFHEQLNQVLQALNGEARLTTVEDSVGCTVRLRNGKGEFSAVIRQHPGAELRVNQVPTDQSYLQETLGALQQLVSDHPVRRALPG